jgi:protein-disulfide isomerase
VGQLARGELPSPIPVEADDTVWGSTQAPVTLVVFIDFQCPFCARSHATVKGLQKHYGDQQLRVVFKHLPLDFHQDAIPAAVALQAVRELGGTQKALAYIDKLLDQQHSLGEENLVALAHDLHINRSAFSERLRQRRLLAAVEHDVRLAANFGINGTPTFMINGLQLVGAQPTAEFKRVIEAELEASRKLRTSGLAPQETYALRVAENLKTLDGDRDDDEDTTTYRVPIADSPSLGPSNALITIVEFSEFQCPFCERVRPTLAKLRQRFPQDIRLVFKHLPLDFHEHAMPAARLAAEVQRKAGDEAFWQATNALFDSSLDEQSLLDIGQRFGLSKVESEQAVLGNAGQARVDRDLNLALDLQARGTPHFFINGRRLSGARPYREFEHLVLTLLSETKQHLSQPGVSPDNYYEHLMQTADPLGGPLIVQSTPPAVGHPMWGPADAPVVMHTFSDFECNFCAKVEPTVRRLRELFPKRLKVVWHNLPLPFHKQARPAAHAALEAFAQAGHSGFHKMHDKMFQSHQEHHGPALSTSELAGYARELGLNLGRFQAALNDGRHDAAIDADVQLAKKLGIDGTPGFIIGNQMVTGAKPLRYLRVLVENSLTPSARQ